MKRPPLLPADRYLASLLGLSEEDYRRFIAEVQSQVIIEPDKPQAGLDPISIIAIASTVISIGLTIAASFFKPRGGSISPKIDARNPEPSNVSNTARIAPRYGFDTVQKPATLQTVIPIIYARRRYMQAQSNPPRPEGYYGGVRVNLQLIWSQMWSVGGGQFLRAQFLLGEGPITNIENFAIGDNLLSAYDFGDEGVNQSSSRMTIYYSGDSGPIRSWHREYGRAASNDFGNTERYGAPTVFSLIDNNGDYQQDFCYTYKPSTSTSFGIYGHIPNAFGYRVNPRIKPTRQLQTVSVNNGNNFLVDCEDEAQSLADTWKAKFHFSSRGHIYQASRGGDTLYPGDTFSYKIDCSSDSSTTINFNSTNTDNDDNASDGVATCNDIASAVASRQKSADDNLIIGELYRAGSCLAVLISRDPSDNVFVSNIDYYPERPGTTMYYTFKVVRGGKIQIPSGDDVIPSWSGTKIYPPQPSRSVGLEQQAIPTKYKTASNWAQIFRCSMATVVLPRSATAFEIGIRSTVGLNINGICNFKECPTIKAINDDAGDRYQGKRFDKNAKLSVRSFQSGTLQGSDTRYSFFRVYLREANGEFFKLPCSFAVRDAVGQPIYNYLRFFTSSNRRWEIRFEPLSSWEIRTSTGVDQPYYVLDPKISTVNKKSWPELGVTIAWNGTTVSHDYNNFRVYKLEPSQDIGIGRTDDLTQVDDWASIAERFVYDEIQTTAMQGPEHEVVYVNIITKNTTVPTYNKLALVGLNIYASSEFNQLSQLSGYVTDGHQVSKLTESNAVGSSNLFPDILRDLLLSTDYGVGVNITSEQIDMASFMNAANWCLIRRYFWDGNKGVRVNIRQWAADVAASMLLDFVQRDGKFALEPALVFPEAGPIPISGLFTAGNIVENSLKLEYLPEEDRNPIQVSVKWREERIRDNAASNGLFPVEREVLVREADRPDTDPLEAVDISEYCTNLEHAIDFACYLIRMRRLIKHTIGFSTTSDGLVAGLKAGDYIQVALLYNSYNAFSNGVVLPDGTVVSTSPDKLGTGTHQIMAWDGSDAPVSATTLTIDSAGKGTPSGIMFVKKETSKQLQTYKIESIAINEEGIISIEAVHHPTDSNGYSLLGLNWTTYTTDSNWVIEGGSN